MQPTLIFAVHTIAPVTVALVLLAALETGALTAACEHGGAETP